MAIDLAAVAELINAYRYQLKRLRQMTYKMRVKGYTVYLQELLPEGWVVSPSQMRKNAQKYGVQYLKNVVDYMTGISSQKDLWKQAPEEDIPDPESAPVDMVTPGQADVIIDNFEECINRRSTYAANAAQEWYARAKAQFSFQEIATAIAEAEDEGYYIDTMEFGAYEEDLQTSLAYLGILDRILSNIDASRAKAYQAGWHEQVAREFEGLYMEAENE